MKQIAQNLSDGRISVVDVPTPALQPHGVIVRTAFSLISAGTERSKVELGQSSLLEKARRRPDDVKRVLDRVRRDGLLQTYEMVKARLEKPSPLGYSAAGVVERVGELVEGIRPGDRVACAGAGYANHAESVYVPGNLCVPVPDGVALEDAAYGTVGAIALQGFRQSGSVLGDRVGVIGLGLVGQLTAQIAAAAGCRVFGVDLDQARVDLALEHGAVGGAVSDVVRAADAFTGGVGLDAVIITAASRSSEPVILAGKIARDKGVVVVVGDVGMDIPRSPFYEKELDVRLSRSYGPGRYDASYEEFGVDYPVGYVRWTERRNIEEFLELIRDGRIDVSSLTTHRYALSEASAAYQTVTAGGPIGVLLTYDGQSDEESSGRIDVRSAAPRVSDALGIGLIGAGNFATGTLLPALKGVPGTSLRGVVTASGLSARDAADRYGFGYCASDPAELLGDPDVDAVIVATRHDSHGELVAAALRAGKAVFVEKPLCVTRPQLDDVLDAWDASPRALMVGFNRRYSPLTSAVREALPSGAPRLMSIRVNAGHLPADHWTQRVEEGGGRIVGEVCHFIDLAACIAEGAPVTVFAAGLGNGKSAALQDSLSVVVRFADGSTASIVYAADGDSGLEKERVEVFCGGVAAVIDDFSEVRVARGGRQTKSGTGRLEKGHREEMGVFVELAKGREDASAVFRSSVVSTLATLAVIESLATGSPVDVPRLS